MSSKRDELMERVRFYRKKLSGSASRQEKAEPFFTHAREIRQNTHASSFDEYTAEPRYKNSKSRMAKVKVNVRSMLGERGIPLLEQHVSSEEDVVKAFSVPTGISSLDLALGGGLPSGAIEIFGAESVGKTTMVAQIIHEAQLNRKNVLLCMSEYFDAPYMERIGIDLNQLELLRTDSLEAALGIGSVFLRSSDDCVFVIDSATGFQSSEDKYSAKWNTMLFDWLNECTQNLGHNSCVVMTNQVRAKRSKQPGKMFAGGSDSSAKKVAGLFDTRLELTRGSITDKSYELSINIMANSLAMPMSFVEVPVTKGYGIDTWKDLVRAALIVGVIEQRGSWYYYNGDCRALGIPSRQLGQGLDEVAHVLRCLRGYVVRTELLRAFRGEGA